MHSHRLSRCFGAALATLLALPGSARAAEGGAASPAARPAIVVSADALGAALTRRYGVQLEWGIAPQTSITINPWLVVSDSSGTREILFADDRPTYDTHTTAEGLDASYRYYTSSRGRFFLAPGLEVQHFATDTMIHPEASAMSSIPHRELQEWSYLGASFDTGFRFVGAFGGVLECSLGAQYRFVLGDQNADHYGAFWSASHGPGLRPRARVALGWAF